MAAVNYRCRQWFHYTFDLDVLEGPLKKIIETHFTR